MMLANSKNTLGDELSVASVAGDSFYHCPVMLKECLDSLNIKPNGTYADCTLGGGGHSYAIALRLNEQGVLHAFDRDSDAIEFASKRIIGVKPKFILHAVKFGELAKEIAPNTLDGIIYDLGISSHQVDDNLRGFTFACNAPIDLRMDRRENVSAQEWLINIDESDLAHALKNNADLDRAYKLATKIKRHVAIATEENRSVLPLDIKAAVESVFFDKKRDINSLMARVFQAIRIEVNGELDEIRNSLRAAVKCLKIGGRMVIMSYHSVEDRVVKDTAREFEQDCICKEHMPVCVCGGNHKLLKKINRKPILPSKEEIATNSRARSAKLRVYERV